MTIPYLILQENQTSADPIVFVLAVDEFETAMPVENGRPYTPKSTAKLDDAPTAIADIVGAVASAGTVAELKNRMYCVDAFELYPIHPSRVALDAEITWLDS